MIETHSRSRRMGKLFCISITVTFETVRYFLGFPKTLSLVVQGSDCDILKRFLQIKTVKTVLLGIKNAGLNVFTNFTKEVTRAEDNLLLRKGLLSSSCGLFLFFYWIATYAFMSKLSSQVVSSSYLFLANRLLSFNRNWGSLYPVYELITAYYRFHNDFLFLFLIFWFQFSDSVVWTQRRGFRDLDFNYLIDTCVRVSGSTYGGFLFSKEILSSTLIQ